jgi:glycine/D-amino acid oxidase-like deaminating enzyme
MLSFWEKNSFLNYDTIIIGGGINGLSAACAIKEKNPKQKILIIEKGSWPLGASTRNAGFACFGSFAEIRDDIHKNGLDKALQLIEWRVQGLEIHKKRLGIQSMGYIATGGGEFILDQELFEIEELAQMNRQLFPILKTDVFKKDNSQIKANGFNDKLVKHYISNACEGQVDSGLLMFHLWQYTCNLGVHIMTGMALEEFIDLGYECVVVAKHNLMEQRPEFRCKTLVFATNAFTKTFFPELDVKPGRGQMLATKPIDGLKFKGIFHFKEGYYYFRNYENRILFGGGRNEDLLGEETDKIALNASIQESLDIYLKTLIIPGVSYEIDCRWAGIMAFGDEKLPIIKRVTDNVVTGVRMGGMGVTLSGITSQKIAELI